MDLSDEFMLVSLVKAIEVIVHRIANDMVLNVYRYPNHVYHVSPAKLLNEREIMTLLLIADRGEFKTTIKLCAEYIGKKFPFSGEIHNSFKSFGLTDRTQMKVIGGFLSNYTSSHTLLRDSFSDLLLMKSYLMEL